jgi:hypothetical protein
MIDLYTSPTPNGYKISVALEELNIPYNVHVVNLQAGDQKKEDFLKLNPNGRIPVIVDTENNNLPIMESGAQIVYLAFSIIVILKYKNLLPLVWLFFASDNILKLGVLQFRYPGPEYTTSTAPGGIAGTFIMLLFTLIMFYLSILKKKEIHGS